MIAEAITRLDNRVFTIEGTIDLTRAHFYNICELAQTRIELEDKHRLAQEQQLCKRRQKAATASWEARPLAPNLQAQAPSSLSGE